MDVEYFLLIDYRLQLPTDLDAAISVPRDILRLDEHVLYQLLVEVLNIDLQRLVALVNLIRDQSIDKI